MRLVVSLVLAVLFSGLSTAHAGLYLTLGIGTEVRDGADRTGDVKPEELVAPDQLAAGRFGAGVRTGQLAVEASVLGTGLRDTVDAAAKPVVSAAVDLKIYVGLAGSLEGYLRGGMSRTWTLDPATGLVTYVGNGYQYGAGLQLAFAKLLLGKVDLWFDYTRQILEIPGEDGTQSLSFEGLSTVVTMGMSVGF